MKKTVFFTIIILSLYESFTSDDEYIGFPLPLRINDWVEDSASIKLLLRIFILLNSHGTISLPFVSIHPIFLPLYTFAKPY